MRLESFDLNLLIAFDVLVEERSVTRAARRLNLTQPAVRKYGDRRRIEVTAPSFIQAPWLLPGTHRLALMHERLARLVAPRLALSITEAPFDLPIMREMMQYHSARSNDAALAWLRDQLLEVASKQR